MYIDDRLARMVSVMGLGRVGYLLFSWFSKSARIIRESGGAQFDPVLAPLFPDCANELNER